QSARRPAQVPPRPALRVFRGVHGARGRQKESEEVLFPAPGAPADPRIGGRLREAVQPGQDPVGCVGRADPKAKPPSPVGSAALLPAGFGGYFSTTIIAPLLILATTFFSTRG